MNHPKSIVSSRPMLNDLRVSNSFGPAYSSILMGDDGEAYRTEAEKTLSACFLRTAPEAASGMRTLKKYLSCSANHPTDPVRTTSPSGASFSILPSTIEAG